MLESATSDCPSELGSPSSSQFGHALIEELCDARSSALLAAQHLEATQEQLSAVSTRVAQAQRVAFQAEWFQPDEPPGLRQSSRSQLLTRLGDALGRLLESAEQLPGLVDAVAQTTKDSAVPKLRALVTAVLQPLERLTEVSRGVLSFEEHTQPHHPTVQQLRRRTTDLHNSCSIARAEVRGCVERIQAQDSDLAELARLHMEACQKSADTACHLAELQESQNGLQAQYFDRQRDVSLSIPMLQHVLEASAALFEEVKPMLKTIIKISARLKLHGISRVNTLLDLHKQLATQAASLIQQAVVVVESRRVSHEPELTDQMASETEHLVCLASQVHDGIIQLGEDTARNAEQWAIHDEEADALEDAPGEEPEELTDEVSKVELHEARNATAISILRRVNFKLSGRDVDHTRKASVSEQVGWTIEQATNVDKLAAMYEGWTAWI